jgi:hypothetical protein
MRHHDRADTALEPDPPGLHVADHKVVLHPVLLADRVDIDLGRAVGHVAQQPTEAIGQRQIACSVPRMIGAHLDTCASMRRLGEAPPRSAPVFSDAGVRAPGGIVK